MRPLIKNNLLTKIILGLFLLLGVFSTDSVATAGNGWADKIPGSAIGSWIGKKTCLVLTGTCPGGKCVTVVPLPAMPGVCVMNDEADPAPIPPPFVGINECETTADCQKNSSVPTEAGGNQCILNPFTYFKYCAKNDVFVAAGNQNECEEMFKNANECDGEQWSEGKTYKPTPNTICTRYYYDDPNYFKTKCVYVDKLRQKPVTCKSDSDCTSALPVCITNPKSGLRECVEKDIIVGVLDAYYGCDDYQQNIDVCSGVKGNTTQTAETAGTICTEYWPPGGGWLPKCVRMTKLVGITKEGGALPYSPDAPTAPPAPKVDGAAERSERFAPRLEISIPNLSFVDKITGTDTATGKNFVIPYIAVYFNAVYRYLVGIGVLLAIIFLVLGGFRWMTAAGETGATTDAKTMIGKAVLGLTLLIGLYVVLYVINPELVQMKAMQIFAPSQVVFEAGDNEDPATYLDPSSSGGGMSKDATDVENCLVSKFDPRKYAAEKNYDDDGKPHGLFMKDSTVGVPITFDGKHPFWVAKAYAPQFQAAANEIKSLSIDKNKIWDNYSGGWVVKRTRNAKTVQTKGIALKDLPLAKISNHSYGAAIDMAPKSNPNFSNAKCLSGTTYPCMDPVPRNIPDEVIYAFLHAGCKWGGLYTSGKDTHHFDCLGECGQAKHVLPKDFKLPPNISREEFNKRPTTK